MKSLSTLFAVLCFTLSLAHAQDPFPGRGTAFQDDIVPRVDILIPQGSLDEILAPGNEQSNVEHEATFIFTDAEEADTVEQVGLRLRGNTSRLSDKKSFRVSFNTFLDDQWKGLEKLNLNGEHNDPTISRAKICWDMLKDMRVPAPRANHVELYINGDYRGLYANVEHVDEEFAERRFGNKDGNLYKCSYPADLAYLGENADAYKLAPDGQRVYELQTNEDEDNYSDLANFISVLTQTELSELPCELEAIFNVDTYLRTMAFDVLTGNWDGYYNKNNFHLYHNTATGKFEYILYDLDNTLGIDWLGEDWAQRNIYNWTPDDEERPLFERMLQVPDYRARYTYYVQEFMETIFNASDLFSDLDEIRIRLEPFVAEDDFYPQDYGFTLEDFTDGFNSQTDYSHTSYGLKAFVSSRRNQAFQQLEDLNPAPYLFAARSNLPNTSQEVSFQVATQDNGNLDEVVLCYTTPGSGEICLNMLDNGQLGDGSAGDGIYGLFIDAFDAATTISWYISATDDENATQRLPQCGTFTTEVTSGGLTLAINEFMASNDMTIADEADEFDDWVEIHNYGSSTIELLGLYLSDNPDLPTKWAFPDIPLEPGAFLIVWADDDEEQGALHTNFKLDADGEFIGIFDTDANDNGLIDGTEFGEQESDMALGRLPNGTGAFQSVSPTPGASNEPLSVGNGIQLKIFSVYPNPMRDQLRLETHEVGQYEAIITDAAGRILRTYQWNGQQVDINLDIPAGMYYVSVLENRQTIFTSKVIKL